MGYVKWSHTTSLSLDNIVCLPRWCNTLSVGSSHRSSLARRLCDVSSPARRLCDVSSLARRLCDVSSLADMIIHNASLHSRSRCRYFTHSRRWFICHRSLGVALHYTGFRTTVGNVVGCTTRGFRTTIGVSTQRPRGWSTYLLHSLPSANSTVFVRSEEFTWSSFLRSAACSFSSSPSVDRFSLSNSSVLFASFSSAYFLRV